MAWRHTELTLGTSSPQCRIVSYRTVVVGEYRLHPPVDVWSAVRAELAAWLATSEARETHDERRREVRALSQWLNQPRTSHCTLAERSAEGALYEVDEDDAYADDAVRVKVLRDLGWEDVNRAMLG